MASINFPNDLTTAKDILAEFPSMAYDLEHLEKFQSAVKMIYGAEYVIQEDLTGRMAFFCKMCNKPMNNETALAEHNRSSFHYRNLDKKKHDAEECKFANSSNFPSTSLQFKLATSVLKPLGIQMIEEYTKDVGPSYYKCILCAAHGKIDPMYHHVVGKKHTEKYIRWRCFLEDSVLTPEKRETMRLKVFSEEGVDCTLIKVIKGKDYFPYKWVAQGKPASRPKAETFPKTKVGTSPELKASPETEGTASPPQEVKKERASPPESPGLESCSSDTEQEESQPSTDVREVSSQKFDLEDLMSYLVFVIGTHTMPEAELKTLEDVRMAMQLIFKISVALHNIPRTQLTNGSCKTPRERLILEEHKNRLEKIMGKIIFFIEPSLKEHAKELAVDQAVFPDLKS
ncbi:uncharacterized protein LOC122247458 [Penaeus japonicus]|uniref:uncharacterized protein LOC122247458 n=1 Tax=Penaeus japonicus TaxID=27405 RepID=UPI001C714050|nr:uncharacterized protein LOC122247458 [Penaeus japonicus]